MRALLQGFLATVLLSTGGAAAGNPSDLPTYQSFRSRPDLRPPVVQILRPARGTAPGYLFIAPKRKAEQAGPMIFDNRGRLVWFRPLNTLGVTDFRVQRYLGRRVLTWWRARPTGAESGESHYTIADAAYCTVAIVRPGNGVDGDIHEFMLTPHGTALMTTSRGVHVGGRKILDGGVQEVDVRTGRVLFDWHGIDHVAQTESYYKPPRKDSLPYDYFHVNSIDVDTDGNLLVSARNTHSVYKISRSTGKILWRLGGKRSDFTFGREARFAWQHDARRLPDGTIRLFDNAAAPKVRSQSRVIFLRLDLRRMRARLVRSVVHRPPLLAINQANAQSLPNGHLLVGWGHEPYVTEFDEKGRMLFDLRFGRGADSYRAYRFRWIGRPAAPPDAAADDGRIYVSWNGATEVRRWQILAGPTPRQLRAVRTVPKLGFETSAALPSDAWVAARALDRAGRVLGTSRAIRQSS